MFEEMDATVRALLFGGLFLVSMTVVLWSIYHGQGKSASSWAAVWWVIGGVGVLLILPALVINAFQLDTSDQDLIDPLSYLGIVGTGLAFTCTAGYFLTASRSLQEEEWEPVTETIRMPEPEPSHTEALDPLDGGEDEAAKTMVMRRPTTPLAYLLIKDGPRRGTSFSLSEVTNIGRNGQRNDIIIADEAVSGEHARVRFETDREGYVYRDLDSTNGSWLVGNGSRNRIEAPHVLKDGDEIEVGSTTFVFKAV